MASRRNPYSAMIGVDLYERTPKAVFAAIAVSNAVNTSDDFAAARAYILSEWKALYEAGIVPQHPPIADRAIK